MYDVGGPREPETWAVIEAAQVHCYLALPVYALHGLASAIARSAIITRERSATLLFHAQEAAWRDDKDPRFALQTLTVVD